jgi:hypothetical protein
MSRNSCSKAAFLLRMAKAADKKMVELRRVELLAS